MCIALLVAALAVVPVASVGTNLFYSGTLDTWAHLWDTVMPEYLSNTLWLCVGVGSGVLFGGIAAGWLTAMHDFPGRRIFEWALVLPMAMPAYVAAYTYTDFLQFVGPLQSLLRQAFGWKAGDYWFPDVRSLPGAIGMFVFVLYPYVYLLARNAFLEQASGMLEVGRSLGLSPWKGFFRISLPLARPALAAGTALALMETLADYGTVSYFAVPTFTTGIYRAWFSLGDRTAAAQLAMALLGMVILVLLLERMGRGRARYHDTTGRRRPFPGRKLNGWRAAAAVVLCSIPVILGFLLPAGLLLHMAITDGDAQFGRRFLQLAGNSVTLAAITSFAAVALAVLLAYAVRLSRFWLPQYLNRVVGLGYAVPGSVIAVGILIPVSRIDNWLAGWIQDVTGTNPGLLLTGGIAALVYAYLVRFLTVALHTVESGLGRITLSMDDAARSLGLNQAQSLARVHVPLLRGSLMTAGLLVFVDVMKELPATLVMRPFNFDTLATQAYTLAADERLGEASTAALAIVAMGLLPVIVVSRRISSSRRE
ncbi:iron ABC transporter permease [Herbaspirillum sp. HC18]|nr:iron ABC transporter permease [Herbaspirillum sp. HC18]